MEKGIYFVHIGDDNYAPTHSDFIRQDNKVHDGGKVSTFSSPPNCQPQCTCTQNDDGTWKIVCN